MGNDLTAVPIYCENVCYSEHDQFFVLVDVNFVSHVFCTVGDGVKVPCALWGKKQVKVSY